MSAQKDTTLHNVHSLQFDKFYDRVTKDLRGRVEVYRDKLKEEKWKDYQKQMIEHLDKAMQNLVGSFEQQMREFAINKIKPLQGVVLM